MEFSSFCMPRNHLEQFPRKSKKDDRLQQLSVFGDEERERRRKGIYDTAKQKLLEDCSLDSPPAQILEGFAARISVHDFFKI